MGAELLRAQPVVGVEHLAEGALGQSLFNYTALAENSTSAIRIRVDSAAEYNYLGVTHTLSEVRVLDTLGGEELTGESIEVWQVGTALAPIEGLARPLRAGSEYMIYTEHLYLEEGKPLDEWVVVAQGSWKLQDGAYVLDLATDDPTAVATRGIADDEVAASAAGAPADDLERLVWDLAPAATSKDLSTSISGSWTEQP